jgi:hypothetical protein
MRRKEGIMMNPKIALAAALIMAGVAAPKIYHAGGRCSRQFDLGSIQQARKKNQRNKNQKRIKSM